MASTSRSLKLSSILDDLADLLYKKKGYSSRNAYIKALIRYDAMVEGEHLITLPISKLSLDDQDKIDQKLLENAKRGIGERGQYLERLLSRLKIKTKSKE